MALMLKDGSIFLHIPKTGGNWVTKVLEQSNLVKKRIGHKHTDVIHTLDPIQEYKSDMWKHCINRTLGIYPPKKKPFMFCFVRHPLSWYESWFKYMSQPSRNWQNWKEEKDTMRWHPNAMLNGTGADNFNDCMRNIVAKRPGYATEMFGWYTTTHVDFIGKQENLREDLITVLKQLDVDFDEEFVRNFENYGVSDKPKEPIIWDEDVKKEVQKLEYVSFVRYSYDPENR